VWPQSLFILVLYNPSLPPTMLDYVKTILLKVSFSKVLFEKELRKALRHVLPAELPYFRTWCYEQFSRLYWAVMNRIFAQHTTAGTPLAS
jgi:hypothetical protein